MKQFNRQLLDQMNNTQLATQSPFLVPHLGAGRGGGRGIAAASQISICRHHGLQIPSHVRIQCVSGADLPSTACCKDFMTSDDWNKVLQPMGGSAQKGTDLRE